MHVHADKWGSDKADPNYKEKARFPDWQRVSALLIFFFGIGGLMYSGNYWCKSYNKYMPKQWPQEKLKCYTYSDKYF